MAWGAVGDLGGPGGLGDPRTVRRGVALVLDFVDGVLLAAGAFPASALASES